MLLPVPCVRTPFEFRGIAVELLVPDAEALNARYLSSGVAAPYWARLWPASLGLCEFLAGRTELVTGKRVLELAAGLGLPGLLTAHFAEAVTVSDIDPDAVAVMQEAIGLNGLKNARARVVDWAAIPENIRPEIVLLSDVNYDPEVFETLFLSLKSLLESGVTILLSTPQRLMAKPFIERLLPWSQDQLEVAVGAGFVNVFVLMNAKFRMQKPGTLYSLGK
jgi:predicted nicotinamide N-methyase